MVFIWVLKTVKKKRIKVIANSFDAEFTLLQIIQEKEEVIDSLEKDNFILEKELFNLEKELLGRNEIIIKD